MEDKISLIGLFTLMRKRIKIILGLTLIFIGIAVGLIFYVLTPIYEAETHILVNQKNAIQNTVGVQQIETDLQLINTYNVIIKSPVILSKVIEDLDLKTTPEKLTKKITVTSENNSQVIKITVRESSIEQAINISNKIAEVFKKEVKILMNVDNVNILSEAVKSEESKPVAPNNLLIIVVAAIAGFFTGSGIAVLLEVLDSTIKTEEDIEQILGISILGAVSVIKYNKNKRITIYNENLKKG